VLELVEGETLHERLHRDVKPSNVLLARGGAAKLADFGIARLGFATLTRTGEIVGTPAYMAPEQLSGGVAHAASDLYALAVVAHEMLTGRVPFAGRAWPRCSRASSRTGHHARVP
jgi:serine/threonine protein kinase